MVQSFDYSMDKPNYNAVKINIKKPEVNVGNNISNITTPNGNYNAVDIEIDNPAVNTEPKLIYDYPYAQTPVTYDMLNPNQVTLPAGFPVTYHTTNVILPKIENEIEIEALDETEDSEEVEEAEEAEESEQEPEKTEAAPQKTESLKPDEAKPEMITKPVNKEEIKTETSVKPETPKVDNVKTEDTPAVPEPNYTTVEAEKGIADNIQPETKTETTTEPQAEDENPTDKNTDNISNDVKIMEEEVKTNNIKKPEIIPGDEILPDVDIPLVISNLTSEDYDVQAQQMEEIARISLDNPENAVPYIVRDVFSSLIDISKKDTTELAAPTDEQVDARKKLIANFITLETAARQNNKEPNLPYKITEREFTLANELSPMEMAERNKEYALYTIAILAKVYTDEVEKQTGNVVPLTDLPGSAAIVDALRYSPNAGVKIAAIDALRHIQRLEYNEELTTLYTLAQADPNPQVAMAAARALENNNH